MTSRDINAPAWLDRWRWVWTDVLAGYYLVPDSLYRSPDPFPETGGSVDFEVLSHLKEQGTLGPFNLGLFYGSDEQHALRFKPNYDEAGRRPAVGGDGSRVQRHARGGRGARRQPRE